MSRRSRAVARMLLAAFLAVSAAGPATAQLAGREIHIGVGGPLTTPSATFGIEIAALR